MKNDLVTAIAVAILGTATAFFICNFLIPESSPFPVKTVGGSFSSEIAEPDVEVFNYKAINPTVEVYVGNNNNCSQYDSGGNCISEGNR